MSSVAHTTLSLKPASTVVRGSVHSGRPSDDDNDALRREKCMFFEKRLRLEDHLRDKRNEERADIEDGCVRVNSKTLRTSYQIGVGAIYGFMKRLHRTLTPGLRVKHKMNSTSTQRDCDRREKRDHNVLYDWITCADFTTQVIPKYPSVLWFDLECMTCKSRTGGRANGERHYNSKDVMKTVISAVLDNIGVHASVEENCDLMYVTIGTTCGMHMFFPQVVVQTEYDGQEIWTAVNKRLCEKDHGPATVDTGCSSMPLPLARNHNGLTRVNFEREGPGGNIKTRLFAVKVPSFKDLVGITNFSHLVSGAVSPSRSSSPSDVCPPSTVGTRVSTVFNPPDGDAVTVGGGCGETNAPDDDASDRTLGPPIPDQSEKAGPDSADYGESTSEDSSEKKNETIATTYPENGDSNDRNSSVSSSSSNRRLVQSDIRTICARVRDKRKLGSVVSEYETADQKRRRMSAPSIHEPIVIDDDDVGEPAAEVQRDPSEDDVSIASLPTDEESAPLDVPVTLAEDDTATSSLCDGYVPSVRFSDRIASSVASTRQEKHSLANKPTVSGVSHGSADIQHGGERNNSAPTVNPLDAKSDGERLRSLHVTDDSIPPDARLPNLRFGVKRAGGVALSKTNHLRNIAQAKETFARNMKLHLDSHENQTHETDMQLVVSAFNKEMDFYVSVVRESTPLVCDNDEYDGLRIRQGCSLHAARENCPNSMFTEHVPYVLCSEDFVTEVEWISVLVRYFDDYLNNAPFLYVMSHVLSRDKNIEKRLNATSKMLIERSVNNCLARFKMDMVRFRNKVDGQNSTTVFNPPKHPYDEKCTVVFGLMAVCSTAYNIITPLFTDLAKVCRQLLGNTQQTLELLNSSTMCTAVGGDRNRPYGVGEEGDGECFFDESVSRAGDVQMCTSDEDESGDLVERNGTAKGRRDGVLVTTPAHIGNEHSIIASILRWNYPALSDQTLWGLFFYYYHVHSDALTRIMDEVIHGGLMVTTLLQAYFEDFSNSMPVDVRMVCNQTYQLYNALKDESRERDRSLMPPPGSRGAKKRKTGDSGKAKDSRTRRTAESSETKRREFESRPEEAKKAQRNFQDSKNGRRDSDGDEDEDAGDGFKRKGRTVDSTEQAPKDGYLMSFDDVLLLVVQRFLRPVSFDETTVVYTERGYEQSQNEVVSYFSTDKNMKRSVSDVFSRSVLKYSMPHGDLLMYNTDVMGTVHRNSTCTNNLVLNVFENMYGGCMSYLTRKYNNHLKIYNRFNADAYRLVVECRHAMNELVKSIELSYLNLILRQPIVPPVLESDTTVRRMFMSEEEIQKGAFVCLNVMDYVRSINMFTRHSKFSQENCELTESFLDKLIVDGDVPYSGIDQDARMRFRTVYLFFQLYVFEVLYKIRQTYSRDGSFRVSVERLSWEMDVRLLLKLFFGPREFKTPRGLSTEVIEQLNLPTDLYGERTDESCGYGDDEIFAEQNGERKSTGTRCINTRPLVSAELPNKIARMTELFGRKGMVIMKSYAPIVIEDKDTASKERNGQKSAAGACDQEEQAESTCSSQSEAPDGTYEERDRAFIAMTQAQLEDALYSPDKWYENCRIRVKAVYRESKRAVRSEKHLNDVDTCMDANSMDTFLRGQLRTNIDNGRLRQVEKYVREKHDFAFCTQLPLRVKMIALVLATHTVKRLTADVATDFIHKEYRLERLGVVRFTTTGGGRESDGNESSKQENGGEERPDREWVENWSRLLTKRHSLLVYCRSLAHNHFPESYFIGLRPDNAYDTLYNYMLGKSKYTTLHALRQQAWAKDVCVALNYLLVTNAYDPELVELCMRLFLGFEWPGQWAKRIFVWKSNSNAGKSYFFEHVIRRAFDQSTCINDPKGGKDNAPEKSEYYKNFVLMINEFSSASAAELKKLCSTSSYKFRMNFGNQMIQAFMVGKMVFNCNTLPLTTDHATIQRVALVPLPFWFQKRQTIVDSMLNWTRGQFPPNDYERNFRRNIANILLQSERNFFIDNRNTKNEDDLFNRPNEVSQQMPNELSDQNARASMFLVQNKTSQVYMMSSPPTGSIVSGIVSLTRYFCRFRFFNNIKEPVDYSVLPTACNNAAVEWQRISQPYFEWKERYQVRKDPSVRTKVSTIYAAINHFTKNRAKNVSFFDLKQFFEWDFAEHKIPYYSAREDEYYVRIDPIQD